MTLSVTTTDTLLPDALDTAESDPDVLDPDVLDPLNDVIDPEIGLSVVDLGLVYEARRTAEAVTVALTLTAQACPLGEMILADARDALAERFPSIPRIDVALVWDPPWDPDRITDRGLERLGRPPRDDR